MKIQKYLDSAMDVLDRYGLRKEDTSESRLATILQEAVHVDEAKVTAIAMVVQYQESFNELVRDNIEDEKITNDHMGIVKRFDSVREDSKTLAGQLADDGVIDRGEKIQNWWMKLVRGTPHERFDEIKEIYLDVTDRTAGQLKREKEIMGAYMDHRMAIKGAEVLAYEVLEKQEITLKDSKQAYVEAVDMADGFNGSQSEKAKLEMARDEFKREFESEDSTYQLLKDVAENLTVGYNVGEAVMAKLSQTHQLKERVHRQAVTFFTTNEHVFTAMDACYSSQYGLHEQTQTVEAMKDGANKGLEDIAELGHELEKAALEAGYGPTINSESVGKLVNSIGDFQEHSYKRIDELRAESTANAQEVARIVDEGKQRQAQALDKYVTAQAA